MSGLTARIERLFGVLIRLSTGERMLLSSAAVLVAVGVGMIVILGAGYAATCRSPALSVFGLEFCYNPIETYFVLLQGAFGDSFKLAVTLQWTTLLLFTGLSFAIPYKAGLFNIGAQGQFVLGSLATTIALLWAAEITPSGMLGRLVLVPVGLLAGGAIGGLYGLLPGYLKHRFEVNEVISTLLLNFIATAIAVVTVDRYFADPELQGTVSRSIPTEAVLSSQLFPSSANFSLLVFAFALLVLGGFYWLLTNSAIGYEIRTMGTQPKAARFGGVSERFTTLFSMTTAGVVAGVGGAVFIMMVLGRWQTGAPPVGFDGIAVSILAGNNPLALLPSGLLFGALQSGGQAIQFQLGIPSEIVGVLRGLIILLVATPELFRLFGTQLERRGLITVDGGRE
jgi:simple sugar transport system permease protein